MIVITYAIEYFTEHPLIFLLVVCLLSFLIFHLHKGNAKSNTLQALALFLIVSGLFIIMFPYIFVGLPFKFVPMMIISGFVIYFLSK